MLGIEIGHREEKTPSFLKSLRTYVSVYGQKRLKFDSVWKGWRECVGGERVGEASLMAERIPDRD